MQNTRKVIAAINIEKKVLDLKQQPGKDVLVGSRSLIIQLINLNLIDEFRICIHPMIEGKGHPLFDKIYNRSVIRLLQTKTFDSDAILLYYEPIRP